eukprot:TRINITY_DN25823_c0_g1_i1.p1 TRINITY_DN25823_c0_g1~~TRINITY_DN25823_c0_g1_i1.p1  ORF type:complete len:175 (+),score=27.15 TRINITY_DN25823_c0_g1_i1:220-744(+)
MQDHMIKEKRTSALSLPVKTDSASSLLQGKSFPPVPLPKLNDDVLVHLLGFLSVRDLFLKISLTCKHWKELVDSGRIFKMDQWIQKEPESNYTTFRGLGRECFDNEEWSTAITYFTRALLLNPKDHLSYFWRAYSFAESEKYDQALSDFTRSPELEPHDPTTYFNRRATFPGVG